MSRPRNRAVFVDVDGTLVTQGRLDENLAAWIGERRGEGFEVNLWSARGQAYARAAAERLGVAHLFDAIISKPTEIVDDWGWRWTRHVPVVTRVPRRGKGAQLCRTKSGEPDLLCGTK